jgi:hypothetical protein
MKRDTEIEPKPACLILWDRKDECEIERCMVFDSHLDALDVAERYASIGYSWTLSAIEFYKAYHMPADTPPLQKKLEGME